MSIIVGGAKPLTDFQQSYHWKNKNCGPWAAQWIKAALPGLTISEGGMSAEIESVTTASGDCDLSQRKGKPILIHDIEIDAKWKGTTKGGDEVTGSVQVPEFTHENIDGSDDYGFNFSLDSSGVAGEDDLYAFVRKALPPALEAKLSTFRTELLAEHGVESAVASGANTPYSPAPPGEMRSKPATPAPVAPASKPASAAPSAPVSKPATPKPEDKVTKTTSVEVKAELQASADDIWSLLTDENRVPMWSRSPAKIKPEAGAPFELFGGNVSGKVLEADKPTKLVQSWQTKSPGWPADHFGTLTTTLDQGSSSTQLTFTLDNVPAGKQADVERALNSFYIQGLKQMGLGSIL